MSRRFAMLILGLTATAAGAQNLPEATPRPSVVRSRTGRFEVTGFGPTENTQTAVWAEGIAERLERRLGRPSPIGSRDRIRIASVTGGAGSPGRVVINRTRHEDGRFIQDLGVVNFDRVDPHEVHAALVGLLLERHILTASPRTSPPAPPLPPPAWLRAGLALALLSEPRQEARSRAVAQWRGGASPGLADVLGWTTDRSGAADLAPFAWLVVDWIEAEGRSDLLFAILRRLGSGRPVDATWFHRGILQIEEARDAEKAWDVWLARSWRTDLRLGHVSTDDLLRMRQYLHIHRSPPAPPGGRIGPTDLVDRWEEPWVALWAARTREEITRMTVGRPESFREVAAAYNRFLDHLAQGDLKGRLRPRVLRRRLQESLEEAETLWRDLHDEMAVVGRRLADPDDDTPAPPDPRPSPDRPDDSDLGSYLDRIERQLRRRPPSGDPE